MAANNNGLTYYKLDAELHGYVGDITKNCGLRGEEIDGNFNFLRGNDIKNVSFDEKGTMYVTKYNGEVLSAKQIEKPEKPEYDFIYDSDEGILTIITPDGNEIKLEGFNVSSVVFHDNSLVGNGSKESILQVSNISKTGRYLPVIKMFDLSLQDENGNRIEDLPVENIAMHDRYITKEYNSHFGRLYPLKGVQEISKRLKEINSEWHVPTKDEWDEILNIIDCSNPTHSNIESNVELGEHAGTILKSTKYWFHTENGELLSQDSFGFSILPVGYCGNRGKRNYDSFGESTAFWTSTVEDNHNDMYVKCFNYDKETVGQHTWGEDYYLSLRLVKKFNGYNFNSSEVINGFTSNCVHIPESKTIWTKENISFSQMEYDSFMPDKWQEYNDINYNSYRYFINDWNGSSWDKHEIREGESVVIYYHENGEMHEWMLVNGELIDTIGLVLSQTSDNLAVINQQLQKEISDREDSETQIREDLTSEGQIRKESDSKLTDSLNSLSNKIDEEIQNRTTSVNEINVKLNTEVTEIKSDISKINENLTSEGQIREESDSKLTDSLNSLSNKIDEEIQKENAERKLSDETLQSNIENEKDLRIKSDNELQRLINENKLVKEDDSLVIIPGNTNETGETIQTTIKVNLDKNCDNLKLGENGIYFDGYFGTF